MWRPGVLGVVGHSEITLKWSQNNIFARHAASQCWSGGYIGFNGFGLKSRLFANVVERQCSPTKAVFLGFNSDGVVHCVLQPLSTPKVLFRRLDANMAK